METSNGLVISTNNSKLNYQFIHDYLANKSYWKKDALPDDLAIAFNNSLCFGGYLNQRQIAFGRVITDYKYFGYLADVFVDPEFQGEGYGKQLLAYILNHEKVKPIEVMLLATLDAHYLYKKFGFVYLDRPERYMIMRKKPLTF